ncbi:MAG: glutaredoxin domain-containing protein [Flavobacteriaceae bacterium]
MNDRPIIKLYGRENCHKTEFYKEVLKEMEFPFEFLDVIESKENADELRALYKNGSLNFPQ